MNNLQEIQMVSTKFESNLPIAWNIKFLMGDAIIGSIEKYHDGFLVTTTFDDAFIADDSDDLGVLLTDLFCPKKNEIN